MGRYPFVVSALLFVFSAGVPVCLGQEPGPSPQVEPPDPCRLCAAIALDVDRDLMSLQPMNSDRIEAGVVEWEEMRKALPQSQAAQYDPCFQNLMNACQFVLDAAQAWAMASQDRVSVPNESFLAMKWALSMDLMSARFLLERAAQCCQPPAPGQKQ